MGRRGKRTCYLECMICKVLGEEQIRSHARLIIKGGKGDTQASYATGKPVV